MNLLGLTLSIVVLASGGEAPPAEPVTVSIVAVQATDEHRPTGQRHFDPALENLREALAGLPYDTFREVKSGTVRIRRDEEATFEITKRYTLRLKLLGKDDAGRFRLDVTIEEDEPAGAELPRPGLIHSYRAADDKGAKNGGKKHKALQTTSAVAPGKHLLVGGLSLKEGKLAVVLTVER